MAGRNREVDPAQDLALRVVGEVDVLEDDLPARKPQIRCSGSIFDVSVHLQELEHGLHVHERLLDLAIDETEEVERLGELHHVGVDRHEIAGGHGALGNPEGSEQHQGCDAAGDNRRLADVQNRQ